MNNKQHTLFNVAGSDLGTEILYVTDEFFAAAERMLQPGAPVFKDEYDDNGHWMDGWETRRRRDNGNDHCIIKLAQVSQIVAMDLDTTFFKGNAPASASVKGCYAPEADDAALLGDPDGFEWFTLLEQSDLKGDTVNAFESKSERCVTHVRIDIYPDGGIARFRAYGHIAFDESLFEQENINVIADRVGARTVYANNEFFGAFRNILKTAEADNMGDGWETRRRREPGYDWGIIELPRPALIDSLMIDTKFFKGNYPDAFSLHAAYLPSTTDSSVITQSMFWEALLPEQKLQMDAKHHFDGSYFLHQKPITHIRINLFPDGGVSRLKMFGRFIRPEEAEARL